MANIKGGVRKTVKPEDYKKIEAMASYGLSVEKIANVLGMSKKTLERRAKENGKVKTALELGRAKAEANVSKAAYGMAVSGKVPAMTMFWLKCRAGWKENQEENNFQDINIDFTCAKD